MYSIKFHSSTNYLHKLLLESGGFVFILKKSAIISNKNFMLIKLSYYIFLYNILDMLPILFEQFLNSKRQSMSKLEFKLLDHNQDYQHYHKDVI